MRISQSNLSRREFLKLTALGISSLSYNFLSKGFRLPEFPQAERLGRVCVGMVELKIKPNPESQTVGVLYEDAVVPWIRETTGQKFNYVFSNQKWVETPQGFVYGPYLQPVYNKPNVPVESLQPMSMGAGMWVQVTVPYVDAWLDKDEPSDNSWVKFKLEDGLPLRFYYGQQFWIDQIKSTDQGQKLYRVNPNYYGGVDMLWADAQAFRPITEEDLSPINPDVTDKRVEVDVNHQILSCYEGNSEVYVCRVSTGAKFNMYGEVVDAWATPVGLHHITRKFISLQMAGGTTGAGYDLPGIGWTAIFATGGVAIHSTFWHNNFGDPVSHGCVNAAPEDAHWIFRWTQPAIPMDPGMVDITVTGEESTSVDVIQV